MSTSTKVYSMITFYFLDLIISCYKNRSFKTTKLVTDYDSIILPLNIINLTDLQQYNEMIYYLNENSMSTVVSMFIILCIIIYCIRCSPTYIFLTLLVPRLFMYKMFHGLHPIGISAMYSQNCDVHSHDTRKKQFTCCHRAQ